MARNAEYWIEKLKLQKHPEGGHFMEIYRSEEKIYREHLPQRFSGNRNFCTSIYYLLREKEYSKFHRIKSDELWHFYDGGCMLIYEINSKGNLKVHKLGLQIENDESPVIIIKAGNWFAAKPEHDYCLAGCTVSPGFDFNDFEIADKTELTKKFSKHEKIIKELT
ncbi:MAG: hypothetical protein HGGPFJEG_00147 [Ignavibacteria bacterium]|nr:hypothetical protein [Ignavibacteria bacterium]